MEWRVGIQLSVVGCQLSAPPKKSETKIPINYSFYELLPYFVVRTSYFSNRVSRFSAGYYLLSGYTASWFSTFIIDTTFDTFSFLKIL